LADAGSRAVGSEEIEGDLAASVFSHVEYMVRIFFGATPSDATRTNQIVCGHEKRGAVSAMAENEGVLLEPSDEFPNALKMLQEQINDKSSVCSSATDVWVLWMKMSRDGVAANWRATAWPWPCE
jgi:hypothetical protein